MTLRLLPVPDWLGTAWPMTTTCTIETTATATRSTGPTIEINRTRPARVRRPAPNRCHPHHSTRTTNTAIDHGSMRSASSVWRSSSAVSFSRCSSHSPDDVARGTDTSATRPMIGPPKPSQCRAAGQTATAIAVSAATGTATEVRWTKRGWRGIPPNCQFMSAFQVVRRPVSALSDQPTRADRGRRGDGPCGARPECSRSNTFPAHGHGGGRHREIPTTHRGGSHLGDPGVVLGRLCSPRWSCPSPCAASVPGARRAPARENP